MVAGPEIARVLQEFESQLKGETNVDEKNKHHEQGLSTQKTFQSHVKQLVSTISEMGNPFKDDCPELLALDTRNCADASVVDTVHRVRELGLRQYKKFVKDVIDERTVSIHDTISKNTLPLFKRQQPKQISKASLKFKASSSVVCILPANSATEILKSSSSMKISRTHLLCTVWQTPIREKV